MEASPRFSWTQPICDGCWSRREGSRIPIRIREEHRDEERCVDCGTQTKSGIYTRINPNAANYPTIRKD